MEYCISVQYGLLSLGTKAHSKFRHFQSLQKLMPPLFILTNTIAALTSILASNGRSHLLPSWAFSLSRSPYRGSGRGVERRASLNNQFPSKMPPTSTKRCAAPAADGSDDNDVQHFLLKSEPSEYSIADMARDVREEWGGIRNYQARNYLRSMKVGDRAFFYHSQSSRPGIVGTVKIVRMAQPDSSAYDPQSEYYDAKSTKENCRWDAVLVEYEETFPVVLTLKELKDAVSNDPGGVISGMALFKQSRLSVVPLTRDQWLEVMTMIRNNCRDEGDLFGGS